MIRLITLFFAVTVSSWWGFRQPGPAPSVRPAAASGLTIQQDEKAGTLSVFRAGKGEPVLTQHARPDFRPYLHPIAAPDGKGVLTEYSPGHHKHQTGLYWDFKISRSNSVWRSFSRNWSTSCHTSAT